MVYMEKEVLEEILRVLGGVGALDTDPESSSMNGNPQKSPKSSAHLPERQDEQGQEQETSKGAPKDDPDGNLRFLGLGDLKCDLEERKRCGFRAGIAGMLSTPFFGNAE